MAFVTYKEKLKALSRKLVEVQKPIRILNSIRVDPQWETELRAADFKSIPKDARSLGATDDLGLHLQKICDQYLLVVELLKNRGRADFYKISRELYGSPKDCFAQDSNTISQMSRLLYDILTGVGPAFAHLHDAEDIPAEQVVETLNQRFAAYFHDHKVVAKISDRIVADAAAGGDKVKIRQGAMFSARDVDLYEVHEGWVHVGTTLNGRSQHICEFLSIGPPRCAPTQEGLAVIMEIFTFRSFIQRAKLINDRIICIEKAEDGANLLEVIEYLRTEGYSEGDCLANAFRVFRGGTLDGGAPFTKDIAYCKGFIENYNFLRSAIRASRPELIPFLFVGKLHVDDIPMLYAKFQEGLIDPPHFLPPHFKDLNWLAVWMSFSSFFNQVDLQSVQAHYQKMFDRHL